MKRMLKVLKELPDMPALLMVGLFRASTPIGMRLEKVDLVRRQGRTITAALILGGIYPLAQAAKSPTLPEWGSPLLGLTMLGVVWMAIVFGLAQDGWWSPSSQTSGADGDGI